MRRSIALLVALAALAPALATTDPDAAETPRLRITELLSIPDATLGQREFIELHNAGSVAVDLADWRIQDAPTASNSTNRHTFAARVLEPGQRIVLWSNGSADAAGPAWSTGNSKWNDAGDAATLYDPAGNVHDWFAYGSTTQAAPAGFAANKAAAPGRGASTQLVNGTWTTAAPTPGLDHGQRGGLAAVTVQNIPPTVALHAAATARTRATFAVQVSVADDNGPSDVTAWTLRAGATLASNGTAAHNGTVIVTAPATAGPLVLTLTATDAAKANATASVTVQVQRPTLAVELPNQGSLRFPTLKPGAIDVESPDRITLRNDGAEPAVPLLDFSPFKAGLATIAVDRNLWIGSESGGAIQWQRYDGPLQPLPELAPGESMRVTLRIAEVPVPTPAGVYGTTFTVIAA